MNNKKGWVDSEDHGLWLLEGTIFGFGLLAFALVVIGVGIGWIARRALA